jgi:hypothetical protein
MVGTSPSHVAIPSVASDAASDIVVAKCGFGRRREILKAMHGRFARKSMPVLEYRSMMPEFYLVLKDRDLHEQLAKTVFEAGFDDSELTVRGDHAAIWVCHREGELTQLVREALEQARQGGLQVSHVEMESEVFA